MQKYSTIIIGAGPGGLACAELLARHGISVLVLEKKQLVGPKTCGGGITWSGLIRRLPETIIERSFHDQYIRSSWQQIKISSPTPIISTIGREELGQWMLKQAREAGAVIKTGINVRHINEQEVLAKNSTGENNTFAYKYLVGADGSSSLVRRYLKIKTQHLGFGIHYHVPGRFDKMEWHLDNKLFNNGYAWIFPCKDFASVGVYGQRQDLSPRKMLANLQVWAKKKAINLAGLKPRAGLINFDYQGWNFDRRFLVGDAAGLASCLTGEGINPAIVSGETVARTIIDPLYKYAGLARIIRKQQKHQRILKISGKNKVLDKIIIELLVLGLRTGIIPVSTLEMAD